ncbi:MAG: hypothetical protein ACQEXJ_24110 [Myxococcota bacterium]
MIAIAAAVLWSAWMFRGYAKDDFLISARYAYNLVHHGELVFNPGERVEGYTNFAWTMLMVPPQALGGGADAVLWTARVVAFLAAVWLGWGVFRYALLLAGRGPPERLVIALLPALLVAVTPTAGRYLMSGMETVPFAAACLWSILLLARRRLHGAVWLGVLACLLRPEGHLVLAVAGIGAAAVMLRERQAGGVRRLLRVVLGPALVVGAYHAWRLHYFGDLLPNTWFVKSAHGARLADGFEDLFRLWEMGSFVWIPLLATLALLLESLDRVDARRVLHVAGLWGLGVFFFAYLVWVGGDEMEEGRLVMPGLVLLAVLAGHGLHLLVTGLRARLSRAGLRAAAIALAAWGGVMAYQAGTDVARASEGTQRWYETMRRSQGRMCRDLALALPDGATVAYQDMGMCPYSAPDLRFFDYIGLVTRDVARLRHGMGVSMFGVIPREGQDSGQRLRRFRRALRDMIFDARPGAIALVVRLPTATVRRTADLRPRERGPELLDAVGGYGFSPLLHRDPRLEEQYVLHGLYRRHPQLSDEAWGLYLVSWVRDDGPR